MSVRFHHKFPLVYTAFLAVTGIAFDLYTLIFITLVLGVGVVLHFLTLREFGIAIIAIGLGFGSVRFHTNRYRESQNDLKQSNFIQVEVESLKKTAYGTGVLAACRAVLVDSNWKIPSNFKVQWIQTQNFPITPGSLLLIRDYTFNLPAKSENYTSFNELNYFTGVGILGQLKVANAQFYELKKDSMTLGFQRFKLKNKLEGMMLTQLTAPSFSLFSGLLLGDKSYLQKGEKELFQTAGLMHILSVSGMHVGLIYWLLSWPISKLGKRFYHLKKIEVILIPVLWLYAYLTGMAPPVFRATVFISIMVILRVIFKRKVRLPDLLATSACLFVIFNPLEFYSISFQLSFAAMLGIAFLFPLWQEKWRLYLNKINGIGDLLGMSICCTIATLPLTLFHFHQIPTWFLLGNLILTIPFTVLIYGYTAHVFFTFLDVAFIMKLLSVLIEWMVQRVYQGLEMIASLPLPYLYAYDFDFMDAVVLSVLIVLTWRSFAQIPIVSKRQIAVALFLWSLFGVVENYWENPKSPFEAGIKCQFKDLPSVIKKAQAQSADTLYVEIVPKLKFK